MLQCENSHSKDSPGLGMSIWDFCQEKTCIVVSCLHSMPPPHPTPLWSALVIFVSHPSARNSSQHPLWFLFLIFETALQSWLGWKIMIDWFRGNNNSTYPHTHFWQQGPLQWRNHLAVHLSTDEDTQVPWKAENKCKFDLSYVNTAEDGFLMFKGVKSIETKVGRVR